MQVKDDTFKENPNIYLLGKKEHKGLPGYVANFDACIIPYLLNEYTETVYPTKLNEYLIMGKPVIATSIPEVDKFDAENRNVIEVTKTKESFVAKIEEALRKKDTPEIKQERINVALKSDWPSRIEKMSSHMEAVLKKKHL